MSGMSGGATSTAPRIRWMAAAPAGEPAVAPRRTGGAALAVASLSRASRLPRGRTEDEPRREWIVAPAPLEPGVDEDGRRGPGDVDTPGTAPESVADVRRMRLPKTPVQCRVETKPVTSIR